MPRPAGKRYSCSANTTTETLCRRCSWKRILILAYSSSTLWPQLLSSQGRVPRRCLPQVWLGAQEHTTDLQLWSRIHHRPRHDVLHRRLSYHPPWWSPQYCCDSTNRSVPQCCHRTTPTTTFRWNSQPSHSQQRRWHTTRHQSERLLEWKPRCIFWRKGFSPKRIKLSLHESPGRLLASRTSQEKGIWRTSARSQTWSLHFTPLVLSTTGGLGREAATFYKRLADLISSKQQKHYSNVICCLRCRLLFAMLQSAIMCVRGSRSSYHRPRCEIDITLATTEGLFTQ